MHETKTAVERRRIVRKNSRVRVRAKKQGGQEKEGGGRNRGREGERDKKSPPLPYAHSSV